MANIEAPVLVKEIHDSYIAAGADIITTNTFRTTSHTFQKIGKAEVAPHVTRLAVELAHASIASSGRKVLLAGSIAPLEDCYRPDLVPDDETIQRAYSEQIDLLISSGVDFILAETMINQSEISFISRYLHEKGFPYMMSFTTQVENLLDGTSLEKVIPKVIACEPTALLLNCRPPAQITTTLPILQKLFNGIVGAYGNGPGHPDDKMGWSLAEGGVDEYLQHVKKWLKRGALIVGGCCGTTPNYIQMINDYRMKNDKIVD
jgi:S-methylmethionine-dependent homocysteine/selenocysteine methylase